MMKVKVMVTKKRKTEIFNRGQQSSTTKQTSMLSAINRSRVTLRRCAKLCGADAAIFMTIKCLIPRRASVLFSRMDNKPWNRQTR